MEDNRRLKDELSYTISSAEKRIYEVGLKHSREIESLNTKILFMVNFAKNDIPVRLLL